MAENEGGSLKRRASTELSRMSLGTASSVFTIPKAFGPSAPSIELPSTGSGQAGQVRSGQALRLPPTGYGGGGSLRHHVGLSGLPGESRSSRQASSVSLSLIGCLNS